MTNFRGSIQTAPQIQARNLPLSTLWTGLTGEPGAQRLGGRRLSSGPRKVSRLKARTESCGIRHRAGTSSLRDPLPQHKDIRVRPQGLRAGPGCRCHARTPTPGSPTTRLSPGQSSDFSPAPKTIRSSPNITPKNPARGKARPWGCRLADPGPARPQRSAQRGRLSSSPSEGKLSASSSQEASPGPLPPGNHPVQAARKTPPHGAHLRSVPGQPTGRQSVAPESRPHTASSGSRRKQLERGTGSLAAPTPPHARTHPLARLRALRGCRRLPRGRPVQGGELQRTARLRDVASASDPGGARGAGQCRGLPACFPRGARGIPVGALQKGEMAKH